MTENIKKKKRKFSITQTARLLVQILFFILLPALYISAFSGLKAIYTAVVHQSFNAAQLLPQLTVTIAVIPLTILLGRFFCGWMCAFGAFGDFINHAARKLMKGLHLNPRFRVNETADSALKYIKYLILATLIVVGWTMGSGIFSAASPWDAFGMLVTVGKAPAWGYVASSLTVGLIYLILIVAGSVFVERFFCRYLCPLGAVFALTSWLRIAKISKPHAHCGSCRVCTNSCAMGLPLYKTDRVTSGECIQCMKCVSACPRNNITLKVTEKDIRPLAAGAAAVTVMTGLYYAGNFGLSAAAAAISPAASQSSGGTAAARTYQDGTYQGTGSGFRGTTTVEVTISNDRITNVTTLSTGDDQQFYSRAFQTVSQQIISSQSAEVDAVSGATYSSNGIMQAVAGALSKAKIGSASSSAGTSSVESAVSSAMQSQSASSSDNSGSEQQSAAASSSTADSASSSQSASSSAAQAAGYKDGTYQGSGTGFRGGTTTVSVTVKSGKITDISTVSTGDDMPFYQRAYSVIPQEIISAQSANVDAVSGATYSSNGIMQAVAQALSQAK